MKKTLTIVLAFTFLFLLAGCDPGSRTLNKDDLLRNTVKIELYEYQNENPDLLHISGKKKPLFDFNNATLIASLDESYFETLINDLASDTYLNFGTALNEPMGKTLVLHQQNGNMYVLFGCTHIDDRKQTFYYGDCYVFDKNGTFVEYIGDVGHLFGEEITSRFFQNNS